VKSGDPAGMPPKILSSGRFDFFRVEGTFNINSAGLALLESSFQFREKLMMPL
jgi:hypothetical protein